MNNILKKGLAALMLVAGFGLSMEAGHTVEKRTGLNEMRVEQRIHGKKHSRKAALPMATAEGDVSLRAMAGGANIYGTLWSSTSDFITYGLYGLTPTGAELKWADPVIRHIGLPMQCGWLIDGKLCGYYVITNAGTLEEYYYVKIDFETGAEESTEQLSIDNGFFLCADYNCDDKNIYGYGLSANGLFAFMKAPVDEPDNMTIIKEFMTDEDCLSMTYNRYDQKFYGVTAEGAFVTVDKNGNQTGLNVLDGMNLMTIYSGLCYAPNEDVFYWNPQFSDGSSAIYTLDIKNSTKTRVATCPNDEQYVFFVTPDRRTTPSTPEVPVISTISNEGGTLSPEISIVMPTVLLAGGNIAGSLTWHAKLDGAEMLSGEGTPGATVEVPFDNIAEGMHVFTFYVSNGSADSDFVSECFYVGSDTPKAPKTVMLGNKQITWSAVTEGVHGGYVDLANLEYEVSLLDLRLDDPQPISLGTTQNTFMAIPESVSNELKRAAATVVARSGGKSSAAGVSNELGLGSALQLDVYLEPTKEDFEAMTVIDANNDGRTWTYSIIQEALKSSFTSKGKGRMDDWVILPAIEFPSAADVYDFSVDVQNCNSSSPDEFLEVLIGTAPEIESLKTEILPTFQPTRALGTYSASFKVLAAGNYYIAFHTTSAEFQEGVLVSNIRVSRSSVSPVGPSEVSNPSATAGANGELSATVSFTLPLTTFSGEIIPYTTTITAEVRGAESVEVSGAPGQRLSATVATVQGKNIISIIPRIGEQTGKESTVEVYTGVDTPAQATKLTTTTSEDMLSAILSWDAPARGSNGGYIDPTTVTYSAYRYRETFLGGEWELLEDVGTALTYTFSVATGAPQDQYIVAIVASNAAGQSGMMAIAEVLLGTPYTLPMKEDFDNVSSEGYMQFACSPWIYYIPSDAYNGTWSIVSMAEIFGGYDEGNALVGLGSADGDRGLMGLPRFSTEDARNPQLTLNMYTGADAAKLTVLGQTYGEEGMVDVGTVEATEEAMSTVSIKLPDALCGKKWVQLYLDASYPTKNHLCIIDEIAVEEAPNSGVTDAMPAGIITVKGGKGEITASGAEGIEVKVYGIDGHLAASVQTAAKDCRIPVAAGAYIVTAGNVSYKVIVK